MEFVLVRSLLDEVDLYGSADYVVDQIIRSERWVSAPSIVFFIFASRLVRDYRPDD